MRLLPYYYSFSAKGKHLEKFGGENPQLLPHLHFYLFEKYYSMVYSSLAGPLSPNQYQDLHEINKGGMGVLYKARDVISRAEVAVKILEIDNPGEEAQLIEEFRIASSLNHPNIVKTFYFDKINAHGVEAIYSVMELCERGSLRNSIRNASGDFSIPACLHYFEQLCTGIREAHKKIVHRDIKPENILIGSADELKLCDFGISKYVGMATRTHSLKGSGTWPYMAPECWTNDSNTTSMDIYSLGIVFFEILTRSLPFKGKSFLDFREAHLFSALPLVTGIRPDVPTSLSEIIRKMTNKRPGDRHQGADEILTDLQSLQKTSVSFQIDRIVRSAHDRLTSDDESRLRSLKLQEVAAEKTRLAFESVRRLFQEFIDVANEVNSTPIAEKIQFNQSSKAEWPDASVFQLRFFQQEMKITFWNIDVPQWLEQQKSLKKNEQIRLYGTILTDPEADYLEIDNVCMIGKAILTYHEADENFGFNVLLVKDSPDDLYGYWKICKFGHRQEFVNHATTFYFGSDFQYFVDRYNACRHGVSQRLYAVVERLQRQHIVDLIAKMPQH